MKKRWLKIAVLTAIPALLLAVLYQRASWRPYQLPIGREVIDLHFTPDGRTLMVATYQASPPDTLQFWDIATRSKKGQHIGKSKVYGEMKLALPVDNQRMLYPITPGHIEMRSVPGDTLLRQFVRSSEKDSFVSALAFSGSAHCLAVASYSPSGKNELCLWDSETGQLKGSLNAETDMITHLFFSPDGKTLLGQCVFSVQVWDVSAGKQNTTVKLRYPLKSTNITDTIVALSGDGQALAVGNYTESNAKPVQLRDAHTGKLKRTFGGYQGWVESLSFIPSSQTLLICTGDPTTGKASSAAPLNSIIAPRASSLCLWDTRHGQNAYTLTNGRKPLCSATVSSDGKLLAAITGNEISIWDLSSHQIVRRLPVPANTIETLAISPDDNLLAMGGNSRSVQIWRLK